MAKINKRKAAQAAAKGSSAAGAAVMNDDLREKIAEALLEGEDPDRIAQRIASSGLPLALAQSEIARAAKSPYLRGARTLQWRLRKWNWVMQNGARLAAGDPTDNGIDELTDIDPDHFHRAYYRASRPALLRGLIDQWPARDTWSLDHFARVLGQTPVRVQWGREANRDYERSVDSHAADRPYAEIDARLRAADPSNDFYVTANNADRNRGPFAPLFREIGEIPALLAPGGAQQGFIWIGPRGTITPWHHDLTNNLLLQIVGRKRVRMVAAHDAPLMRNDTHCFSRWGTDDLPPGPATADKPAVLECEIGPGDALFLPVGWWHHVEGLEPHIGMSFTAFRWNNDFYTAYDAYRR